MSSSSSISSAELKEALGRYPALIKKISSDEKPAEVSLESLDRFRYIEAPAAFSKQTGRTMEAADVQQLMAWKLRHGKWRPSLTKLVSSNSDETVADATKAAFAFYASNPTDITGTLKLLATPLKGIGPATASLLLSVHDPKHIMFFSDEAYRFLVADGGKVSLKYDLKEYETLHTKAQALSKRIGATPMDIEKAAFVIIKENEPVKEVKGPYVPSGKPRGRPALPESEKKPKKAPSGLGRGRPKGSGTKVAEAKAVKTPKSPAAKAAKAPKSTTAEESSTPAKRGRPAAAVAATSTPATGAKKRGRPAATKTDEPECKEGQEDLVCTFSLKLWAFRFGLSWVNIAFCFGLIPGYNSMGWMG